MNESEFIEWLGNDDNRAVKVKVFSCGLYGAVKKLLFHWTLIIGQVGDTVGYDDRYCYQTEALARAALEAWDGRSEPQGGWHRHPSTGRRRPGGDPAKEHVEW